MEIILVLVVVAVLGYWAWTANNKPKTETAKEETPPMPESKPEVVEVQQPAAVKADPVAVALDLEPMDLSATAEPAKKPRKPRAPKAEKPAAKKAAPKKAAAKTKKVK